MKRESEITKNIKVIEWIKVEILNSISMIYNLMLEGVYKSDETLKDAIANLIMVTYLLAKRLGIDFYEIDNKIKEKATMAINEEHKIEQWYNDLSHLKKHIKSRE